MVQEAAAEVHALLDDNGITSFVKTTGNRGLHVYVHVEPGWDSFGTRQAPSPSPGPRRSATGPDHRQVVEGGARRQGVHRLQPERSAQDGVRRLVRPGPPRSPGLRPVRLGGAAGHPPRRPHRAHRPRGWPHPGAIRGPTSRRRRTRSPRSSSVTSGISPPASLTAPWPPVYPKMPDEARRVNPSRARPDDEERRRRSSCDTVTDDENPPPSIAAMSPNDPSPWQPPAPGSSPPPPPPPLDPACGSAPAATTPRGPPAGFGTPPGYPAPGLRRAARPRRRRQAATTGLTDRWRADDRRGDHRRIGCFLPWLTIADATINGFDEGPGEDAGSSAVVFFAVVLVAMGITTLAAKRILAIAVIGIVAASFSLLISAAQLADYSDFADSSCSMPRSAPGSSSWSSARWSPSPARSSRAPDAGGGDRPGTV